MGMEDSFEGLDEANADRVKRTFAALAARGVARPSSREPVNSLFPKSWR